MTAAERARSAAKIAGLATLPKAAGALALLQEVAGAVGIGAVSAVALLGAVALLQPDAVETAPSPAVTAVEPAASALRFPSGPASEQAPSVAPALDDDGPALRVAPSPSSKGQLAPAKPARNGARPPPGEPEAASSAAASHSQPEGDSLARETALLGEAGALIGKSPSEALARLDEHRKAFPQGKLGIEREVLTIDALLRLRRNAEARARGEALLARPNGSIYAERVRSMLSTSP
jgi:hypothetical protein